MGISQGKRRRSITMSEETWRYLEMRLSKQINLRYLKERYKTDTISCLIEEIVLADKKVYEAFRTSK